MMPMMPMMQTMMMMMMMLMMTMMPMMMFRRFQGRIFILLLFLKILNMNIHINPPAPLGATRL